MPKIDALYVWVCHETDDPNDEGIPAAAMQGMMMPLVGGDMERIASFRKFAQSVANRLGRPVELRRFTGYDVIESLQPVKRN